MVRASYPSVLSATLGNDGYAALIEMQDDIQGRLLSEIAHRFDLADERRERRLAEECGKLRVEMDEGLGKLRVEMHEGFGHLRVEMHEGFGVLRTDLANQRADLMKWAMLFWVTQAAAVAAIVAALR
jgi:hypothetical protein